MSDETLLGPLLTARTTSAGPVIDIFVGVGAKMLDRYAECGLTPPPPLPVRGLIDTGATLSGVSRTIMSHLGLTPDGIVNVHSSAGGIVAIPKDSFEVCAYIWNPVSQYLVGSLTVTDYLPTSSEIDALIGWDILRHCDFTSNRDTGVFTLQFRPPST